jgi:hypothetical protein
MRVLLLLLFLLAAATLITYREVGGFGFLAQDDEVFVTGNPRVTGGLTPDNARWSLTALDTTNWYPLTWLSHQATVALFGMRPGAHHGVNLLLHLLAAALLMLLLEGMTGSAVKGAAVAALFALHPLHVESVAWVTERSDVLAGVFFAATALAYLRYVRRPGLLTYAAVPLVFALALASKATVVALPFVLLLLDLWPLGRLRPCGAATKDGRCPRGGWRAWRGVVA